MSYPMVLGSEAARASETPGVLGYLYNHGGLNNQKMALLGLLLAGLSDRVPVNLPYIYNKDQKTDQEYVVGIGEIFDLERILDFGRRYGLTIGTGCPSGKRDGWEYFNAFSDLLKRPLRDRHQLESVLDAVVSLQPRISADPTLLQMKHVVQQRTDTVVQMRIEADWQPHAERIRTHHGDSESGLGYMEILSKLGNTFPDLRAIYVTADEKSMPVSKHEIRAVSRARFDLDILWKSDLLSAADLDRLTPLDLSLIDFEIARTSPRFVGLTTSTFSNMLSVEKLAATRRPVRGHYFYNQPQEGVIERTDSGFAQTDLVEALLAESDAA